MMRATFTAAIALLYSAAAATPPPVTVVSPCECPDNHGKGRLAVKNDLSTPPADTSAIQAVTPSDIFSWPGPDVRLTGQSGRTGIENNWYALTGRVVAVKAETDGDIHIALQGATGDKAGIVVAEVPAKAMETYTDANQVWGIERQNHPWLSVDDELGRTLIPKYRLTPKSKSDGSFA